MPFPNPMMGGGFPPAPGMMNYSGTIHINPKFAGNVQVQQEMLRMQQQQQWQQQAMAFQQAGAIRMPFFNNPGHRNTPRPFAGGQHLNKEVRLRHMLCHIGVLRLWYWWIQFSSRQGSTTIDDAGVKTGRERNSKYQDRVVMTVQYALDNIDFIMINLSIPLTSTLWKYQASAISRPCRW